jgi:hypothetical protein
MIVHRLELQVVPMVAPPATQPGKSIGSASLVDFKRGKRSAAGPLA